MTLEYSLHGPSGRRLWCSALRGKLVLLSAFPGSRESPAATDENIELQWTSSSPARVRTILERSEATLREEGIPCETRSDEGDPADVLVRLAAECGADLLVVGNKGNE